MGGGGGSAGTVQFPAYIETFHGKILNDSGADNLTFSIVDSMNDAHIHNPFTGKDAYDPSGDINTYFDKVSNFENSVITDPVTYWKSVIDEISNKIDSDILNESNIEEAIAANDDYIDDKLLNETIPNFEAGISNMGIPMSSAFAIGRSVITSSAEKDKNLFAANLRLNNEKERNNFVSQHTGAIIDTNLRISSLKSNISHQYIEASRIKFVMKNEYVDMLTELREQEYLWDLELFQHADNALASVQGSSVIGKGTKISRSRSALGGALAGAAAGAGAGPFGALIGAGVGLIAGALSAKK